MWSKIKKVLSYVGACIGAIFLTVATLISIVWFKRDPEEVEEPSGILEEIRELERERIERIKQEVKEQAHEAASNNSFADNINRDLG